MNVGFYFECSKKSGAVYHYALNLLDALKADTDNRYTVFTVSEDFPLDDFDLPNWEIIRFLPGQKTDSGKTQVVDNKKTSGARRRLNLFVIKNLRRLHLTAVEKMLAKRNAKKRAEGFTGYGIDVMIFHGPSELSFLSDIPSIVTVHDVDHALHPEFPEISRLGQFEKRQYLCKNIAKFASKILVSSDSLKKDFCGLYGIPSEKVSVIGQAPARFFDRPADKTKEAEVVKKFDLPEKFLVYPAQFWPHKNHLNLLLAIIGLHKKGIDVSLVLPGIAQNAWPNYARAREMVAAENIGYLVRFLGFIDENELKAVYQKAYAMILPSRLGPARMSVFEAWQSDLSLLYADIGGTREQAGDAALFFDPNNPESMAGAIEMLWNDRTLRKNLAKKGRERLRVFSRTAFESAVKNVLNEWNEQNKNKEIVELSDHGEIIATLFRRKLTADGVRFLTPLNYPFQVGLLEHKNGKMVPMHRHRNFTYDVRTTQEFLYVEKGAVDVVIANKNWQPIKEVKLEAGDFILFTGGAHSININKGSRIIEIKQGPYPGDARAKIIK